MTDLSAPNERTRVALLVNRGLVARFALLFVVIAGISVLVATGREFPEETVWLKYARFGWPIALGGMVLSLVRSARLMLPSSAAILLDVEEIVLRYEMLRFVDRVVRKSEVAGFQRISTKYGEAVAMELRNGRTLRIQLRFLAEPDQLAESLADKWSEVRWRPTTGATQPDN